jgi:hypothetical protein
MLIIPEETREYFLEVQKIAYDRGLAKEFDDAMMQAHLYGCDWTDPWNCKFTLYKDFAPLSFSYRIEFRDKEEKDVYIYFCNGGLIYEGPDSPADGSFPSFTVSVGSNNKVGWFMHS